MGVEGFFRTADTTYLGTVNSAEFSLDFEDAKKAIKPEERRELADALFFRVLSREDKQKLSSGFKSLYF